MSDNTAICRICGDTITKQGNGWSHSIRDNRVDHEAMPNHPQSPTHLPECSSNDPSCFYQAGCDCRSQPPTPEAQPTNERVATPASVLRAWNAPANAWDRKLIELREGGGFHWKHGVYFKRLEDGSVRVLNFYDYNYSPFVETWNIAPAEWDSIVSALQSTPPEQRGEREFDEVFCGCSDYQLSQQLGMYWPDKEGLRTQHTLRLQKIHNTGPECPNPKTERVRVAHPEAVRMPPLDAIERIAKEAGYTPEQIRIATLYMNMKQPENQWFRIALRIAESEAAALTELQTERLAKGAALAWESEGITRWQKTIYEMLNSFVGNVDASGCDTGDPLEFTLEEIRQALDKLQDDLDAERAAHERTRARMEKFEGALQSSNNSCKRRGETIKRLQAELESLRSELKNK